MKKIISLMSIAIATILSVFALAYYMRMDSFTFAWALNFLLMMWVSAFVEVANSPMTSAYYNEKGWERKGKIYTYLGVNLFRKLLVLVGWEKLTRKTSPIEKNTQALLHLHHQTKKSELGHLIILIIVLGFTLFVAVKLSMMQSLWLMILNVLLNLYPVILQRYNRPRIQRAIQLSKPRIART
nr:hypothetical protein [uncultured Undibacterium sp.]